MTSGPVRRDCGRCGGHGFPAARFPDGYLCGPCLRAALDIRGTCPACGTIRALPGRHGDRAAICRDCAAISRHFTCLQCGWEGNLLTGRLCSPSAVAWSGARLLDNGTGTIAPALQPCR